MRPAGSSRETLTKEGGKTANMLTCHFSTQSECYLNVNNVIN